MALQLLILREEFRAFDAGPTIARIEAMAGIKDCRRENIFGALLECSYTDPVANDRHSAMVTFHEDARAIGIGGPEIHAFGFAFALQSIFDTPLRLINSNYDFDLRICDFSSAAELIVATESR